MSPSAARKKDLRRSLLARRNQLATIPGNTAAAAQSVADRAIALFKSTNHPFLKGINSNTIVGGYWPIRSELDPRPLMTVLAEQGAQLALPTVSSGEMIFRHWLAQQALVEAGFGTLGPDQSQPVAEPDILLVPLVAFDRAGHRLGYGQGCYDGAIARLLSAGKELLTVGLAFDEQEINHVPIEAHDQPLDVIITPMQSIIFR